MKVVPLEPSITSSGTRVARVVLDPSQPYLSDHRPAGDPLLGTVMSIEAVARCAQLLVPDLRVEIIESIENHAPFVLKAGVAPEIEVSLTPDHTGQHTVLRCAVASAGNGNKRLLHMHLTLRLVSRMKPPAFEPSFAASRVPMPVTSQDIYTLFFHGPALRVIGAARWQTGYLYSRSAPDLQPCFASTDPTLAAPRLIEFALQSAGLFEIAKNQRMMIPHAIRRIERFSSLDIDCGHAFWAIVSRCPGGVTPQDLDVEVFDAEGRCHLRVDAYQTLPMPYVVNPLGVTTLAQRFS